MRRIRVSLKLQQRSQRKHQMQ
uniref:Uncharacterized protein n=1 Tax=Arundo donax TaxID=35708 RepID=A0A0A9LBL9_ARUDO